MSSLPASRPLTLSAVLWQRPASGDCGAAPCLVFGSNLRGNHGMGAARFARERRGAVQSQAEGHMGNSYAVPTKDVWLKSLPLPEIARGVARFLAYARAHPNQPFEVTAIGCGLAGLSPAQIAPLFARAPTNCQLPERFLPFVPARGQSWVRAVVDRNVLHPDTAQPGVDRLLLFAANASHLHEAIAAAERKHWQLWQRDETVELAAVLLKPAGRSEDPRVSAQMLEAAPAS